MNFVVLSSSWGTTFQAVIDRLNDGSLGARCIGLVTDSPDKQCIRKAQEGNIPFKIVEKVPDEEREILDHKVDKAIHELMEEAGVSKGDTVLAAMGWMWIYTPWFIREWKNRILNVHPALLPKYGGKGMYGDHVYKAVMDAGDDESGITIHLMDEGVDTGKILLQKKCEISPADTMDTLKGNVQALEKEWYPKVLQMIETGEIQLP